MSQQVPTETKFVPTDEELGHMADVGMEWNEKDAMHVTDKKKMLVALHEYAKACKDTFSLYSEVLDFEREKEWNEFQLREKFKCLVKLSADVRGLLNHVQTWRTMDVLKSIEPRQDETE